MKMKNKENPWHQSYSFLHSQGEMFGATLRIWQWIALFFIFFLTVGLLVVDLFLLEIPNVLHISGPAVYIAVILAPYGGLQDFLDWYGWPYLLRRADQELIDTPLMRITSRIVVNLVNASSLAWLLFFKDYKFHVERELSVLWFSLGAFVVLTLLVFVLLDRQWLFKRTMTASVIALLLIIIAVSITFKWWWVFQGREICPDYIPIQICDL